jgi:dihydrofolate reductase
MTGRKLVYYVAATVDHYIAREDETVDGFLSEGPHIADYLNSLRDYDTVLMGKNTYEWGYRYGVIPGEPSPVYSGMMHYIFSRSMDSYQHERLQVVREDAAAFVQRLKQQPGGSIYLCGGGQLAGSLLDQELIDELILKLHPVTFGKGIPLFGNSVKGVGLVMNNINIYPNGVMHLHYTIRYQ